MPQKIAQTAIGLRVIFHNPQFANCCYGICTFTEYRHGSTGTHYTVLKKVQATLWQRMRTATANGEVFVFPQTLRHSNRGFNKSAFLFK
jgi:hypothetical protein